MSEETKPKRKQVEREYIIEMLDGTKRVQTETNLRSAKRRAEQNYPGQVSSVRRATASGQGNFTNHPSRKGVKLKPEDEARTKNFPGVRLTPEHLANLYTVLAAQGVKLSEWVENHIKADFTNLTKEQKTHNQKAKTRYKTT